MIKKGQFFGALFFFLFCFPVVFSLYGQNQDLDIQLEVNPELSASEIADLSKMASGERVQGRNLFTVHLYNNSSERADDLYLDITFSAEQEGVIWELHQRNNLPFFMRGGQSYFATNNDLATNQIKGLPGDVTIEFEGQFTENGHMLINKLRNDAGPFPGEYVIEAGLYRNNNKENGGTELAHTSATIHLSLTDSHPGRGNSRANARSGRPQTGGNSLVLIGPGDHVNSRPPANISNPYPEFRWEGPLEETYRVVVVERQSRQNPESLIQNARDTGASRAGVSVNLLEFEKADVLIDGTGFQYPSSGVAPLENGKQYFWQVFMGEDTASEIWAFRLTGGGAGAAAASGRGNNLKLEDQELREVLAGLLGMNVVRELERGNYELLDIELGGEQYSGEMAVEELNRLIEKIRSGQTKINRNQRP
ncbi:MAG: hypothetical protein WD604_09080 [Balneolaceae bacterium]